MHNSLAPGTPLASCLTDRVDQPISLRLCVPLEPRGKPTGPLTKSSVKFCESKEAHQFVRAQTTIRISTHCFFICGYFYRIISDIEDLYTYNKVSCNIYSGENLLFEALLWLDICSNALLDLQTSATPSYLKIFTLATILYLLLSA